MHWSKTRHREFEACPRRFFYAHVAAPQNARIRRLAERSAPPLVRHEAVRSAIRWLLHRQGEIAGIDHLTEAQEAARRVLRRACDNSIEAEAQITISDLCIESFYGSLLPSLTAERVRHIGAASPTEFQYNHLSFMAQPELVVELDDTLEVMTWRTGSRGWHNPVDSRWKALGLTCWARSVLKAVEKPVISVDVYLQDGCAREQVVLTDDELQALLQQASDVTKQYSRSAKIRDFPAAPDIQTCRFCHYTSICKEHRDHFEIDYDPEPPGRAGRCHLRRRRGRHGAAGRAGA